MKGGRVRLAYSVVREEIEGVVAGSEYVKSFLGRHVVGSASWQRKAHGLCSFFKWLRLEKGLDISPEEFLNLHLQRRQSLKIGERQWALNLVLQFSRDNPDLKDKNGHYRYSHFFLPVKLFCDLNEAPLTTAEAVYTERGGRSFQEPECTSERIKQALSLVSQRDRAILMVQLQSGQSIRQVLLNINVQADYVFREIDAGKPRVLLDFPERKGNGFHYFSFIGADAIQELQKWRKTRDEWLNGKKNPYLFITREGEPVEELSFLTNLRQRLQRRKLWTGPYSFRTHMLRKFFESQASPPDRGISKGYVAFMMGHKNGVGVNAVDAVGGVYDRMPHIDPTVVEKEYARLEPYLNLYTSRAAAAGNLQISGEDVEALKLILNKFKQGKIKILD